MPAGAWSAKVDTGFPTRSCSKGKRERDRFSLKRSRSTRDRSNFRATRRKIPGARSRRADLWHLTLPRPRSPSLHFATSIAGPPSRSPWARPAGPCGCGRRCNKNHQHDPGVVSKMLLMVPHPSAPLKAAKECCESAHWNPGLIDTLPAATFASARALARLAYLLTLFPN